MALRQFTALNDEFVQSVNGTSVRGDDFIFLAGNDRLLLQRNDDLAGLSNGLASMGEGRDVVLASFNMSGLFDLGGGNDFFLCEGDVSFNGSTRDIDVLGGLGDDLIVVATDFCRYDGGDGNDTFVSDGSRNTFIGGAGIDTYSLEASDVGGSIDLLADTAFGRFSTPELILEIENVRGSIFDDEIFGDPAANRIDGLDGNDVIDGDAGNDTISGGSGTNSLAGNLGLDTLVVDGLIAAKVRTGFATVQVRGSLNGASFVHNASGFEQVLDNGVLKSLPFFLGETPINSVQPTTIEDTAVQDKISGFFQGQRLQGSAGANVLSGGDGFDDISGLGGNDVLRGEKGEDDLSGGSQNDQLFGGEGADRLNGGTGDDTLNGDAGFDVLIGGRGRDQFDFLSTFAGSQDSVVDYKIADDTLRLSAVLVGLGRGALLPRNFKNTSIGSLDQNDRIVFDQATGRLLFDANGSRFGAEVLIATFQGGALPLTASEIQLI